MLKKQDGFNVGSVQIGRGRSNVELLCDVMLGVPQKTPGINEASLIRFSSNSSMGLVALHVEDLDRDEKCRRARTRRS